MESKIQNRGYRFLLLEINQQDYVVIVILIWMSLFVIATIFQSLIIYLNEMYISGDDIFISTLCHLFPPLAVFSICIYSYELYLYVRSLWM